MRKKLDPWKQHGLHFTGGREPSFGWLRYSSAFASVGGQKLEANLAFDWLVSKSAVQCIGGRILEIRMQVAGLFSSIQLFLGQEGDHARSVA